MFSLYSLFGQLSSPLCSLHIDRKSTNHLHCAAVSVHGWRGSMEDAHNICLQLNDHGLMLWGVYDGHGGPRCAQYLSKQIPLALKNVKDIRHDHEIASIFANLDRTFLRECQTDDGSTACVVLAQWWDRDRAIPLQDLPEGYTAEHYPSIVLKVSAINVGDSRATIISQDGNTFIPLTKDHKPNDQLEYQRIIAAGGCVQNERVDGSLALSRSFGDQQYKCNESLPFNEQKVICLPDITTHYLLPGQMLVVCCDGLFESDAMDYAAFAKVAQTSREHYSLRAPLPSQPEQFIRSYIGLDNKAVDAMQSLGQKAERVVNFDTAGIARDLIAKSHEYGSKDNHTAIVIHFCPTPYGPMHPDGYEYIPGPCHSLKPDTTFLRCFRTDVSPLIKDFNTIIPVISATDHDYLAYCHWFENMQQFMVQLKLEYDRRVRTKQERLALKRQQLQLEDKNAPIDEVIDISDDDDNGEEGGAEDGDDNGDRSTRTSSGAHSNRSMNPDGVVATNSPNISRSGSHHRDGDSQRSTFGSIPESSLSRHGKGGAKSERVATSRFPIVTDRTICSQYEQLIKTAYVDPITDLNHSHHHHHLHNNNNTSQSSPEQPIQITTQPLEPSQPRNDYATFHDSTHSQFPPFESKIVNLYYPLPYFGTYLPTGSTLMPFYYPHSRSQYPEWLDAFVQHSLSHGDDCDYY